MGYLEAFVPLLAGFLSGLGADPSPASVPTIDDGVVVSAYLDAALASAGAREWRPSDPPVPSPDEGRWSPRLPVARPVGDDAVSSGASNGAAGAGLPTASPGGAA